MGKICDRVIDLSKPQSGKWEGRGFGRRFVWVYVCPWCGQTRRVRAGAFIGRNPVPGVGGIYCGAVIPDEPLDKLFEAMENHGQAEGTEMQLGDAEEFLRLAFSLMPATSQGEFLNHVQVREFIEREGKGE